MTNHKKLIDVTVSLLVENCLLFIYIGFVWELHAPTDRLLVWQKKLDLLFRLLHFEKIYLMQNFSNYGNIKI